MGYRRDAISVGEWYHCYNRGIDKRCVFETERDSERFLQALYLSNNFEPTNRNNFDYKNHEDIFLLGRGKPLVSVGVYSLMPNHFHILLQEIVEGGISKFMHKLGTSYTMYFNEKNGRTGNLFTKPFRSKHVGSDRYLRRVAQYIHLNPAEMFEREWKRGKIASLSRLKQNLLGYPYSSYLDYLNRPRIERAILDPSAVEVLSDGMPSLPEVLGETREYYSNLTY